MSQALKDRRLQRIDEHIELENRHDLNGIMGTFASSAYFDDEPWHEHSVGLEGVRAWYSALLSACPDLHLELHRKHAAGRTVVAECTVRGTHLGDWHGLPPTGNHVEFPCCAVYEFAENSDALVGERLYYDRATVLHQLGVLHNPESGLGRTVSALTHPITMAKVASRRFFGRRRPSLGPPS